MQNTSQTFRGAGAPGVNFSDHAYDNHVGVHCQPTGYQPYTNPPYHPIPSPRPHHYANHQMQSNMPYRHHGGAYAPNQNQYGQNMNQEMYRNHHSGYVGGPNSRSIPTKAWSENNASQDLMSPYGQVSHPQMMNNPSQMPVNSMRSPPHATSNMNPAPPQNQQHFRQMQSPAHSPHSWSQAQIPSPGVMHSSRTTPSPLPAHVRSPGHSQQPFSPPAAHAMNMPPHPQPPENGQIPPQSPMNPAGGTDNHNPSNPLHSLQKMVLLEQDPSKAMLPMMGDGSEQFPNQCGSHNFVPDETANNESKDSAYSTYYNMDENRFESKPNNTTNDSSYSTVQQVSNCNFPLPSHPLNNEEVPNAATVPNNNSNMHDVLHSVPNTSSPVANSASSAPLAQCKTNIAQNDCTLNLAECPPHAESAPVFTDQTKAAVSTNSEQALESKSSPNWALQMPSNTNETSSTDIPLTKIAEEPSSSAKENSSSSTNPETVVKFEIGAKAQIKQEKNCRSDEIKNPCIVSAIPADKDEIVSEDSLCDQLSDNKSVSVKVNCKEEKLDIPGKVEEKVMTSTTIKLTAEVHNSDDVEMFGINLPVIKKETTSSDDSKKTTKLRQKSGFNYEEAPSLEIDVKDGCQTASSSPKIVKDSNSPSDCDSLPTDTENCDSNSMKDIIRNPVKVVIHRIRKSDTDDTWHVPTTNSKESYNESNSNETKVEKKAESKIPNVGPQIIILSPAVSQKKFGFRSSVASNNVITVSEESSIIETVEKDIDNQIPSKREISNSSSKSSAPNSDKKRGRPVGSKNKLKPGCVKKKKGRKGSKKKKFELTKNKVLDTSSKPKRLSKMFSGPYVHIVGSKENPTSIKVINVAQKEEEKLNKIQSKRNFSSTISRIKKKPVGHLSTLSPTYDAFNRDKTWLCVFCHKGSHHGGLGDLYGPYYIKDKNTDNTKSGTSTSSTGAGRRKRRKSEIDDSKPSKRARQTSVHSNDSTPVRSSSQADASSDLETSNLREVWIHEDCAVWCQSISLIGEEVQGLEEAVTEASENICCQCSLHGATVGCWGKGCKEQYHFSCAKEIGCQMDIEKFSLLCPQHQGSTASSATLKETGKVVKTERKSSDRRTRCQ
ncbi:uncharacterized protein CG5098 [Nephila pilipes]|uniref:Uncharacterized protein CG5098 n=1 Tax=Nephila pilipes TaxID=299642 RepID=A0A8X6QMW0_NEPPI|nr:uncharacterized protein CG5098 [Nephila pilipes]